MLGISMRWTDMDGRFPVQEKTEELLQRSDEEDRPQARVEARFISRARHARIQRSSISTNR